MKQKPTLNDLKLVINKWGGKNIPTVYLEGESWYEVLQILANKVYESLEWIDGYFDTDLESIVEKPLKEWIDDGTIQVIISEVLQTQIDDVDGRVNVVDSRVDSLDSSVNVINSRVNGVDNRVNGIDSRVNGIDSRVNGIDSRVVGLKNTTNEMDNRFSSELAQKVDKGNVSVSDINKNLGKLDQTFMSDEFLQQMSGNAPINSVPANNSLTTSQFTDKAVTVDKTTFAKKGKNLFSGRYELGKIINGGGDYAVWENREQAVSAIIHVEPNETYSISKSNDTDRFRIGFTKEYPNVGELVNRVSHHDNLSEFTLVTQENDYYMLVYLSSGKQGATPSWFQVEKNSKVTEFESPHATKIDLASGSVSSNSLAYPQKGQLVGQAPAFNVLINEKKIITKRQGGLVYAHSKRYDLKDGEWSYDNFEVNSIIIAFHKETQDIAFFPTAEPISSEFIILGTIRVNEENVSIDGMWQMNGRKVKPFTGIERPDRPQTFVTEMPSGSLSIDPPSMLPNDNRNIDTLYNVYNNLVNDFPNQVSRTFLKNEESGLPLYRYESKPLGTVRGASYPKIVATVTHGHEVQASYGLAYALDFILRGEHEILETLRNNVHFIIIPQLNPYGFNRGKRPNFNGVDIARNFSAGWHKNDDPEIGYGVHGEAPLTEIANQEMDKILNANKDALFVLDNHNYGGDPYTDDWQPLMWIRGTNYFTEQLGTSHARLMGNLARKDGYVPSDIPLGNVHPHEYNPIGSLTDQVKSYNMDGAILENMNTLNGSATDPNILKFNIESVINLFITVLRYNQK